MNVFGSNQTPRLTTGFLDTQDDPVPGTNMASPSGSIVQPYAGFVGGIVSLSASEAYARSAAPGVATTRLYGGLYQYVQFKAGTTAANVRGGVVFWDDFDLAVVTPDATATNSSLVAGVSLFAVTKGNYGWIAVGGKCLVKFKSTLTKAAAAGDLVVVDVSGSVGVGDVLADATAIVSPNLKLVIGKAIEAPTNGGMKLVWLSFVGLNLCARD